MIKIMQRIAEMPERVPVFGIRPIPRGRDRVVNVAEPPDRIDLVVEMNPRQAGSRRDSDGVPAGGIRASGRTLHWSRLPCRRDGPRKNGRAEAEVQNSRNHQAAPIFHSTGHGGI